MSKPSIFRSIGDFPDSRTKFVYDVAYRYPVILYAAVIVIFIFFPTIFGDIPYTKSPLMFLYKYQYEASILASEPDRNSFIFIQTIFFALSILLSISVGSYLFLMGKRFPLRPDQTETLKLQYFVRPFCIALLFILAVPFLVGGGDLSHRLMQNPLALTLLNLPAHAMFVPFTAALCLAAGRYSSRISGVRDAK